MRIALGVSYDGSQFQGWQSQVSGNTIQDNLESALARVGGGSVRITGAGRTDAGVHAVAQIAHFDTEAVRPPSAWVRGVNSNLPETIAVQWSMPVADEFHARFSAFERSYRYVLYNHPVRSGVHSRHAGWFHRSLDIEAMCQAASILVGEHDFSAFRSSECQAKSPVRKMRRVRIVRQGPFVLFDFTANAFLHHMVRNIVGCLVYVGKGRYPPQWLGDLMAGRDRRMAAPTISAAGLYLTAVSYEARWQLPDFARMMPFQQGNGE